MTDAAYFELVTDQLRRTLRSLAEEMRPVGPGFVALTPSLPQVWSLNHLHIAAPVAFAECLALAEEHLAGLPHRHVVVEGDETSSLLEDGFRSSGWRVEREVLMVLSEPPDREVDTTGVAELSEEQMLLLMRRWNAEEYPDVSDDVLDQVVEYNRREGRLWKERRFGFLGPTGEPLAITKLRSDQKTAWVEDVYTVPEARGRSYARRLVSHAAALARAGGHDLTFIIADDEDWPKDLYRRIGFRPIGRNRTFHRESSQDRS